MFLLGAMHSFVYSPANDCSGSQLPLTVLFKMENDVAKYSKEESAPKTITWDGDKCIGYGVAVTRNDNGDAMTKNLDEVETWLQGLLFGLGLDSPEIENIIP